MLDDVDQVFEVARLADQAVEVVEDDAVDDTTGQVGEQAAELGADDDPVDAAVGSDDLALLERRGVVLLVDLCERSPSQTTAGDELGQLVVQVEGDAAAAGVGGDLEVAPFERGGELRAIRGYDAPPTC
ncbi:hypothetical protein [Streptomyces sp. NPDC059575]|uniref:hypothetical protein n=1 Tax=Streptomyces sp. NPDC059575 TaxID=3346872 RepID=UPI00369BEDF6